MEIKTLIQRPISSISKWALEHELYEKTHKRSHFEKIFTDASPNNIVSIAYHVVDNKPVSVLVFEHYFPDFLFNRNKPFQSRGKRYSYGCMGYLGLYVNPEYRLQGLAKQLVTHMKPHFLEFHKKYNTDFLFIAANSHSNSITEKNLKWMVTQAPLNSQCWLSEAKNRAKMGYKNNFIQY